MKCNQLRNNKPISHAIITGGSSGIGFAIAKILVQNHCSVTLLARGKDRLVLAQQALQALCGENNRTKIHIISVDVCDPTAMHNAVTQAMEYLGTPQYVIMSAGVVNPGYFEDLKLAQFHQDMDTNYFGSLHTVQAVLPFMKTQKTGKLVFVSSAAGLIGLWGYGSYSPSKFAVRGLAQVLRGELLPHGIQVSIAFPADTDTPQFQAELPIRPKETSVIAGAAKVWSADDMARAIMIKVDKGRFKIAPGLEIGALAIFGSLVTPVLNWWFDFLVKRKCR
jgi:3-dehydrosphinganine reductase